MSLNAAPYHILETVSDPVCIIDRRLSVVWANRSAKKLFGKSIVGGKCFRVFHRQRRPCDPAVCAPLNVLRTGRTVEKETALVDRKGRFHRFWHRIDVIEKDRRGNPVAVIDILRDITLLRQAAGDLQRRIKALKQQMAELEQAVGEIKSEEFDAVLDVLMENQQNQRAQEQDALLLKIQQSIEPYLEQLMESRLNKRQQLLAATIQQQLKVAASSLHHRPPPWQNQLTPQEIRVADLIRIGKTSKEIALVLGLSPHTVQTHRRNIRKKLGCNGSRQSLHSRLMNCKK